MKTTQHQTAMFDWDVEFTTNAGETKTTGVGSAPTAEAAAARIIELYGAPAVYRNWHAVSAKALRFTREHCPDDVQIARLTPSIDELDRYRLNDERGRNAYYEHTGGSCHIRTAFEFLTRARPDAKWKTVGLLCALRQAFREDSANCRTDEMHWLIERGPTRGAVMLYLSCARERDRRHHGQNTF